MMKTLQPEFKNKIQQITKLSMKVNNNDKQKILTMIQDHAEEIEELYNEGNDHWAVETADLIVLCFEMLISEHKDIDEVFTKCLPRFDKKLEKLAEERIKI